MNRREFSKIAGWSASLLLPHLSYGSFNRIEPATRPTGALGEFEKLHFGVSFHFSMNTFTGNDYETGGVPASTYNPTDLDVRQWIRVAHDLGARYAVLTAPAHRVKVSLRSPLMPPKVALVDPEKKEAKK